MNSRRGGILVVCIVAAVEMVLRLLEVVSAPFYALFIVGPTALAVEALLAQGGSRCGQRRHLPTPSANLPKNGLWFFYPLTLGREARHGIDR